MDQERTSEGEVVTTSLRMSRQMRDSLKIQAIKAGCSFNTLVLTLLYKGRFEEMKQQEAVQCKAA